MERRERQKYVVSSKGTIPAVKQEFLVTCDSLCRKKNKAEDRLGVIKAKEKEKSEPFMAKV